MNLLTIPIILLTIFFSNIENKSQSFDNKLDEIILNFKAHIMNKDVCLKQRRETDELIESLNDELDGNYLSNDDKTHLLNTLKEAKAIYEFITVVGDCGDMITKSNYLSIAVSKIGCETTNISNKKYCVDILTIKIDKYIAYIALNNSISNQKIFYKWKSKGGQLSGSCEDMGVFKMSYRHLYNNRENPSHNQITLYDIKCNEF